MIDRNDGKIEELFVFAWLINGRKLIDNLYAFGMITASHREISSKSY